jgi:hypothetical protein
MGWFNTRYRVNKDTGWFINYWAVEKWNWYFPIWVRFRGGLKGKQDAIELIEQLRTMR